MKVRESGMPAEELWQTFFDPSAILLSLGLDRMASGVAEFGCGYGTFTLPAARIASGPVYALELRSVHAQGATHGHPPPA